MFVINFIYLFLRKVIIRFFNINSIDYIYLTLYENNLLNKCHTMV